MGKTPKSPVSQGGTGVGRASGTSPTPVVTQRRGNGFAAKSSLDPKVDCATAQAYARQLGAVRRELSLLSATLLRAQYDLFEQKLEVGVQTGVTVGLALVSLITGGLPLLTQILIGASAAIAAGAADSALGPDAKGLDLSGDAESLAQTAMSSTGQALKGSGVPTWESAGKITGGVSTGVAVHGVYGAAKDATGEEQVVDQAYDATFASAKARLKALGFPGLTDKTTANEIRSRIDMALLTEFPAAERDADLEVLGACTFEEYDSFRDGENQANAESLDQGLEKLDFFGISKWAPVDPDKVGKPPTP